MASITRLSEKLLSLLACCLLAFAAAGARAEGINVTRSSATLTTDGRLSVNSRFQTELPGQLQVALKQGVPLNFQLSYRLQSPTLAAYRWRLGQLVGSAQTINYKLAYHPLTDRYRVEDIDIPYPIRTIIQEQEDAPAETPASTKAQGE